MFEPTESTQTSPVTNTTGDASSSENLSVNSIFLGNKYLYTYFVITFRDISPSKSKHKSYSDTPLYNRRGVINIIIVKRTKQFTAPSFGRYMKKYYPETPSLFQYCYDVTNASIIDSRSSVSSSSYAPIAELYKLVNINCRSHLNHYRDTSERIHPIDSKNSFKTYDCTNYLSTIHEVSGFVEQIVERYT